VKGGADVTPLREVTVKIGKKAYYLRTSLDDESLKTITGMAAEIAESINTPDQENVLLLSCLHFAWQLKKMGKILEKTLEQVTDKEEQ